MSELEPIERASLDPSASDDTATDHASNEHAPLPGSEVVDNLVDDTPRALAPRVRTLWRLGMLGQAILPSALLGVGAWVVSPTHDLRLAIGVALIPWVIAGILSARLPGRRYTAWRYRVTDDALRLDRGVMVRVESVVPYTRIQHVDTEQGPIERALGLTRVIVHTASGSGSTLSIPGLTPADASALRERLAALAGVVEPL